MDHWNPREEFSRAAGLPELPATRFRRDTGLPPPIQLPNACPHYQSERIEKESKNCISARKVQKADREKLRRDRLNEHFLELGNRLDPERPKNDKATVLTDTIQMLKNLTAQVTKLKSEYVLLSEESRELTQEKNELREEKAALKSEIDILNAQYQQRLRIMYPWATMDASVVVGPPPFPYPVPIPIPPGAIPMHHPTLQPYAVYQNQSPGIVANPFTSCMPYAPCNCQIEQTSNKQVPLHSHPNCIRSHNASRQHSTSKSLEQPHATGAESREEFSDVATELELKTPSSVVSLNQPEATHDQKTPCEPRKGKHCTPQRHSSNFSDGSSSSGCCSSSALQDASSSSSVGGGSVAENN